MRKLLSISLLLIGFNSFGQSPMFKLIAKKTGSGCSYLLDQYSGAAAAYSLRLLDCQYAGSAIRVRRSSDNTESDIGFVNGNLDTATLKTFVGTGGTDDGFVVTVYDQSGNTNDATQSTSGSQPKIMDNGVVLREGSMPTMTFDGTDDYFSMPDVSSSGDWSVFIINKRSAAGVIGAMVATTGIGPNIAQWSDNNFYIQRTTATTDYYAYQADATAVFSLINGYNISNVMSAYKNGAAYTLSGETGFAGTSNNFNTIGRYSTFYSNANISEVLIWTSDQSANRTGIQTNVNTYYAIY